MIDDGYGVLIGDGLGVLIGDGYGVLTGGGWHWLRCADWWWYRCLVPSVLRTGRALWRCSTLPHSRACSLPARSHSAEEYGAGCCKRPLRCWVLQRENEAKFDLLVSLVDAICDVRGIAESKARQHVIWQDAELALNQRVAGRPGSWTVQVDGAEESEHAPTRLEKVLVDSAGADVTADGFTIEWGADGCDVRWRGQVSLYSADCVGLYSADCVSLCSARPI